MCSGGFLVEDIESRQTDVRDFFLTESNYRCGVLRRYILCRTNYCRGCVARQRQRPSDSQNRDGFRPTPSLRSLLRVRHGGDLPYKLGWVWLPSHQSSFSLASYGRCGEIFDLDPISGATQAIRLAALKRYLHSQAGTPSGRVSGHPPRTAGACCIRRNNRLPSTASKFLTSASKPGGNSLETR